MATEGDPTDFVKVLHLLVISFTWGMQVWVSFIAGKLMYTNVKTVISSFNMSHILLIPLYISRFCADLPGIHAHVWSRAKQIIPILFLLSAG